MKFKDKTVLITGGASGIGKIMGWLALERGARLIIWDINRQGIDAVAAEFSGLSKVYGYQVDVSSPDDIARAGALVTQELGGVDILINNAGIVVGRYFHEHNTSDIDRTMRINADGPMHVTREFLRGMIARNSGHICNIASSAGFVANPKMSVYAASKWAVIGWSDSIRLEMEQLKKNIGVTTVTPYYINTGMFHGVRSRIPLLDAEKVSARIIRAIERDRILLSMPWSMHFVRFSQGILPIRLFDWMMGSVLGIYHTMEHFTGRK